MCVCIRVYIYVYICVCVYTYVASSIIPNFRLPDHPKAVWVSRDKSDLIDTWFRTQNPERITKLARNILTGGGLAS